ncbi:septum formation protein [Aliiroseovarius sediminilitoris]|uniref:Nucleoside triphosphate pyrophosphatase n=1 Tax=Aliiroseovarius sediminilitoris TaxID=1173584 RepID=A0A1I0MRY2_9RHOB|nr:Maf family nucleotide pyrophosphatase [Aliiroseovarius sediminilitoris]SEV91410.1 septum formation protein [Aliiroseovarius sediminilitoris]
MATSLILASASDIRAQLLRNAEVEIDVQPARIDEETIRASLEAEGASPRDVADALAEFKARKISEKNPGRLVLGCDQIAELGGEVLSKPRDEVEAKAQLAMMSGQTHRLLSAAVLYQDGKAVWRHVGVVRLRMRELSRDYIDSYVTRNWNSIRHAVGAYKLEEEGVRLFAKVDGDYFNVLGLPLTELLSYLILRGDLEI